MSLHPVKCMFHVEQQLCCGRIVVHFALGKLIALANDVVQKMQVYPLALTVILRPHSTRSYLFLGREFYQI